jgi:hypothetical protein
LVDTRTSNRINRTMAANVNKPRTKFTRMYRVSEFTYEVDFLANHNSASSEGQVAFLSNGGKLFPRLFRFRIGLTQ